jgi:hypothetical protein
VEVRAEVFSDEPPDAPTGDGTTVPDAVFDGADLYVRAERIGGGDGRVYLLLVRASTPSASGVSCRTVVVPRSGSPAAMTSVAAQAEAARAACVASGQAPAGFHLAAQAPIALPNRAPSVSAGDDQAVDAGTVANLLGTVADDGLPAGVLTVAWTRVSGPPPPRRRRRRSPRREPTCCASLRAMDRSPRRTRSR